MVEAQPAGPQPGLVGGGDGDDRDLGHHRELLQPLDEVRRALVDRPGRRRRPAPSGGSRRTSAVGPSRCSATIRASSTIPVRSPEPCTRCRRGPYCWTRWYASSPSGSDVSALGGRRAERDLLGDAAAAASSCDHLVGPGERAELEGEQPAEQRVRGVLVADVDRGLALHRHPARPLQGDDGLADAGPAADEHEVLGPDAAVEDVVERLEAGRELGRACLGPPGPTPARRSEAVPRPRWSVPGASPSLTSDRVPGPGGAEASRRGRPPTASSATIITHSSAVVPRSSRSGPVGWSRLHHASTTSAMRLRAPSPRGGVLGRSGTSIGDAATRGILKIRECAPMPRRRAVGPAAVSWACRGACGARPSRRAARRRPRRAGC